MVSHVGALVDQVADTVSTALLLTARDGSVVWHNRSLTALLCRSNIDLSSPNQRLVDRLSLHDVEPEGAPVDIALPLPDREESPDPAHGKILWLQIRCRKINDLLLYEIIDVTEMRQAHAKLAYLTDHDLLTGLVNRRMITKQLETLLRGDGTGALLAIDIDNFKDINDLRGHAVGDEVMRCLADLLRDHLPNATILGRLGGDEFAVVVTEGNSAYALSIAESLINRISSTSLQIFQESLSLTLSIGVVPIDGEDDCDALLVHADLALYEAKKAGRNRARLYAPEQYRHAVQRVNIVRRVRDALNTNMLELDAQPIVDLTDGRTTSYELLVRLRDGMYPEIGPAIFLPMLEKGDLVCSLDRWVITQAINALSLASMRHSGIRLDVNVSSKSMEDADFGNWVVENLRERNIDPPRLGLEITETTAISNLDAARRLAATLTAVGCRFSLDDFGAGFGSFVYLKHLPFTTVKIAGEFVRQADARGVDRVLVDVVVRAAHGLGMTTVAEYVDREPLVAALRQLGVDRGQGYHLGRPSPLRLLINGIGARDNSPTHPLPRAWM